jgi:hypothetical protein
VQITAADVIVTQTPAEGWGVAVADGETVALDLAVSPSLRAEGLAREVVRRIQEARKACGLAVTDRISLRWSAAGGELAGALAAHGALIADEVLAQTFEPGPPTAEKPGKADKAATRGAAGDAAAPGGWHEHVDADLGLHFWLAPIPAQLTRLPAAPPSPHPRERNGVQIIFPISNTHHKSHLRRVRSLRRGREAAGSARAALRRPGFGVFVHFTGLARGEPPPMLTVMPRNAA